MSGAAGPNRNRLTRESEAILRSGEEIVGRVAELEAIELLLDPRGRGPASGWRDESVLLLEGEAGIGKTTIWREGLSRASDKGYLVLSCRGSPSDSGLSFAALGDLLAPVEREAYETLPDPQRRALDVALLRTESEGAAPDPRSIGTGVLSLVSALAADAPVLLALDDVHWLDSPSARALAFALRRLERAPVAVLATLRPGEGEGSNELLSSVPADRVRRQRLGPLSLGALYQILTSQFGKGLTRPLLGRIEQASGGNPLYALEIMRALETDGPPTSSDAIPVPDDMRELMARRLRRLPGRTRAELLRMSALSQPTVSLIDGAALAPAEEAGVAVIRSDGRVEFAHPLFAAAVYASAAHEPRRRLHEELAGIVTDVEERARHLSLATEGPDGRVAVALEEAADLAYRRGAPEVAAELVEEAARRTPAEDVELEYERLLRAAGHHLKAGDLERAQVIAERVVAGPIAPPIRARSLHLLAETRAMQEPGAAIPLLEQALGCAGSDASLAAQIEMSFGFVSMAVFDPAGADLHLSRAVELAEVAHETGLLAEALALRALTRLGFGMGLDEGVLEQALALEDPDRDVRFQLRASFNVAQVYLFTGRFDPARELLVRVRERIVARGEESDLSWVLAQLASTSWAAGDLDAAEAEANDALRVAALADQELFQAFALIVLAMVRAVRGDGIGARADAARALGISERIGWPHGITQTRWAEAFVSLSEGDAAAAVATLDPVLAGVEAHGIYEWPLAMFVPDGIEALVVTGDLERAGRLTAAFADWGRRFDRPWPLAASGRSRALLAAATGDLEGAQAAAEQALVEHERLPFPLELGRTYLVLGQILRRRRHERAAREALETARATFERAGAALWVARASEELRSVPVRRKAAEGLTPTEQRVAELIAAGRTNREVAQALFISSKTVEAHLTRVYRKLGVHTRAELGARMAERKREGEPKT